MAELPPAQVIPGGAIGLNVTIRTERSFGRLSTLVQRGVDATRPQITPAVVEALQGPRSLWPVDTGLSKASFRTRGRGIQTGPNPFSAVINTALNRRGKTYANYVEAGVPNQPQNRHAAARTVVKLARQIRESVRRRVAETTRGTV